MQKYDLVWMNVRFHDRTPFVRTKGQIRITVSLIIFEYWVSQLTGQVGPTLLQSGPNTADGQEIKSSLNQCLIVCILLKFLKVVPTKITLNFRLLNTDLCHWKQDLLCVSRGNFICESNSFRRRCQLIQTPTCNSGCRVYTHCFLHLYIHSFTQISLLLA